MIEIKMLGKVGIKGYTLLEGFPGVGLVGPMAISYIVEKLNMHYIGYVESPDFPPLIAIHNDMPMPAVRIYADPDAKIVTVLAEFAVPLDVTYELTEKLYEFVRANGIAKIISIGGLPSPSTNAQEEVAFGIASTDDLRKEIQKAGLKPVEEGVATGISALMLLKSVPDRFPDMNILVPVDPNVLDPRYAETAIKALNKITKLNIDVKELEKEAKEVESRITELLKRNREMQDAHKKAIEEAGPPAYA